MVLGYILLIVMPIVVVAYIVWDHRRKMAEREAASAGRLQELLGVAALPQLAEREGLRAPVSAASAAPATAVPSAASLPQSAAVPAAPLYAARERVLSSPQTLLYYLLRTGLPDHVILARVTLASLLEAGPGLEGVAREEQTRRLSALTVDFVVADKGMRPVTVIDLAAHGIGGAAQADRAATRTRLAAAGVRYLELEPTALPRKDAIRAVVLDETDSTNAPRAATAASPVEPV